MTNADPIASEPSNKVVMKKVTIVAGEFHAAHRQQIDLCHRPDQQQSDRGQQYAHRIADSGCADFAPLHQRKYRATYCKHNR